MHNLSGLASQLSKKALDAGSALADAQRRVTQQAMEATGMADKTEEDEPAELQLHNKLEGFMRRAYKHTDQYMRAMNTFAMAWIVSYSSPLKSPWEHCTRRSSSK